MRLFTRLLLLLCVFATPLALRAQREKLPPEDLEIVEKQWPEAKRTSSGLRTLVLKPGVGDPPVPGNIVAVLYTGKLINGKVFDQAEDRSKPFSVRVGRGNVIAGWEEALQMMRPGEKRLLIVPAELGYGTRGAPPRIPRSATLVFEVELVSVKK